MLNSAICQMPNTQNCKLYFYSVSKDARILFLHSSSAWRMFTQRKRESRSVREGGREVEELFTFGQLGSTCQASRNLISLVQPRLAYFCLAASHRYTYILNRYIYVSVASVAATSCFLSCRGNHPSCGFYFCLSHQEYENLIFMPLHQMRHQHLIFLQ